MRLLSNLLTLGTQAPEDDLRLLDEKSMIGGRLQTGSRTDGAVHIGGETASAADDVVVVVSHPRLVACRVSGRLNASNEPRLFQSMQIVVHGLCGERAEALPCGVRNGLRIRMSAFSMNRRKHGEAWCGHPQPGFAKRFLKCGFVERHVTIIDLNLE